VAIKSSVSIKKGRSFKGFFNCNASFGRVFVIINYTAFTKLCQWCSQCIECIEPALTGTEKAVTLCIISGFSGADNAAAAGAVAIRAAIPPAFMP
jgi:hypothetical protein